MEIIKGQIFLDIILFCLKNGDVLKILDFEFWTYPMGRVFVWLLPILLSSVIHKTMAS